MLRHRAAASSKVAPSSEIDDDEDPLLARGPEHQHGRLPHYSQSNGCCCWFHVTCMSLITLALLAVLLNIHPKTDGVNAKDQHQHHTTWNNATFPMTDQHIREWSTNLTFVIAGANSVVTSGVIFHLLRANTARQLILACRHVERCQETVDAAQESIQTKQNDYYPKIRVSIVALDLNSMYSIRACGSRYIPEQLALEDDNHHLTKLTLVWNAHDPVHHPIRTNALGHLYLTHLLYPHLERVVAAVSIVGGLPWTIHLDEHYHDYSSWLTHYGTSKRALLLLAQQLMLYRDNNHKSLQVVVTQAGLTCAPPDICAWFSMTPRVGSQSHLFAMLHPHLGGGEYVGHEYVLWGRAMVVGTLEDSTYHMDLDRAEGTALWDWSLQQLNISKSEF